MSYPWQFKKKAPISKNEILSFFKNMNCKSFSTWQEKQLIIDTFIKRIYLWEDKILIIYRLNPRDDTSTSDEDIAVDYITKALSENVSDNAMLGSSSWARTSDIMINSHALCQLSYRGIYFVTYR